MPSAFSLGWISNRLDLLPQDDKPTIRQGETETAMPRAGRSKANDEDPSTQAPGVAPYLLRLYVAGSTPKSTQAIQIVKSLCASFPRGRFKYEVIDLYQTPGLARQD